MALSWNCSICTFENVFANVVCVMCQTGQRPQNSVLNATLLQQFGLHPQRPPVPEHKENYPVDVERPRIQRQLSIDDISADFPTSTQSPSSDNADQRRLSRWSLRRPPPQRNPPPR